MTLPVQLFNYVVLNKEQNSYSHHHKLSYCNGSENIASWKCDKLKDSQNCRSEKDNSTSSKDGRWRCDECDFDLCKECL